MKKGDLVRILTDTLAYDPDDPDRQKRSTIKAIVLEDYTGDKLVRVYIPSTGMRRTYHASQVQLHRRAQRPKVPFLSRIDKKNQKSKTDEAERID